MFPETGGSPLVLARTFVGVLASEGWREGRVGGVPDAGDPRCGVVPIEPVPASVATGRHWRRDIAQCLRRRRADIADVTVSDAGRDVGMRQCKVGGGSRNARMPSPSSMASMNASRASSSESKVVLQTVDHPV